MTRYGDDKRKTAEAVERYQATFAEDVFVVLETLRVDAENYKTYLFSRPVAVLEAYQLADVAQVLDDAERCAGQGYHIAGYMNYEAGCCFEPRLSGLYGREVYSRPIVWFGVFESRYCINHRKLAELKYRQKIAEYFAERDGYTIADYTFGVSCEEYAAKIAEIKEQIAQGNTYQINFTFPMDFSFRGDLVALYGQLRRKQRVGYGAFIRNGHSTLLSLSPELFFRRDGNSMVVKPMKGTVKRGRTIREDEINSTWLRDSEKNRAENAMIVDLLRNDLGQVSTAGSVQVEKLFEVEKYETLFQMTSTVESQLSPDVTYGDIFRRIFPSGSVTGAPKISSMEIIRRLENGTRGIYTGCIGFIAPKNQAVFNIPIRTVEIIGAKGRMGIGSGVTWDSSSEDEFRECCLKAEFLTEPAREFQIIETMLVTNGQYRFLEKHLARLTDSANYFGFSYDVEAVRKALGENQKNCKPHQLYKTRLLLDCYGQVKIENHPLTDWKPVQVPKIEVADSTTCSQDVFLYHKTTCRNLYNEMYSKAVAQGLYDYLFINEFGQVTESCIGNVFIKKDGMFYTPPIECGLLNGVMRQVVLQHNRNASEAILGLDDIRKADGLYLCNSIRGMVRVDIKF